MKMISEIKNLLLATFVLLSSKVIESGEVEVDTTVTKLQAKGQRSAARLFHRPGVIERFITFRREELQEQIKLTT